MAKVTENPPRYLEAVMGVLAEQCHPVWDPLISTNSPEGLFILNDESFNG